MLKIKLTFPNSNHPNNIDIQQYTGTFNNEYKNYKFFFNSDEKEVDFWFIFENLPEGGEKYLINTKNFFFFNSRNFLSL